MAGFIPNVASGIAPQQVSMIRVRVDPPTVFGLSGPAANALLDNDAHVNCPIGVPLFTTQNAINRSLRNDKHGDEELVPVIFNLGGFAAATEEDKLRFVGVSYAPSTRKHSVLTASVAGMVTIPRLVLGGTDNLVGTDVQWVRAPMPYGSPTGPVIGIAGLGQASLFRPSGIDARVMSSGPHRFTVLLG